ncbi:hypothetical protein DERP_010438 [Dermatophagoides pteronyssinus]|uniref:Uncharacterized protein n=1 Tax=Dermatophagoides pteronyssinus TaxID=6956 RepID=A0ABQ8J518_DERPT|nr:hypothetical protein DERP_010438 [Dermatophagoides pteronyssinus]
MSKFETFFHTLSIKERLFQNSRNSFTRVLVTGRSCFNDSKRKLDIFCLFTGIVSLSKTSTILVDRLIDSCCSIVVGLSLLSVLKG